MPRLKTVDQLGMDERAIDNDDLLTALESYHNAREESRGAGRITKEAKAKVKALLDVNGVGVGDVIRIGRFRIERKFVPGGERTVNYSDSETIELGLVED